MRSLGLLVDIRGLATCAAQTTTFALPDGKGPGAMLGTESSQPGSITRSVLLPAPSPPDASFLCSAFRSSGVLIPTGPFGSLYGAL